MKEYLGGETGFKEKEQLLSKLYFGTNSFKDMKQLIAKFLSKRKDDQDLSDLIESSKIANLYKNK
jgi:hypothetical protein